MNLGFKNVTVDYDIVTHITFLIIIYLINDELYN